MQVKEKVAQNPGTFEYNGVPAQEQERPKFKIKRSSGSSSDY
jgi:hypothetical protein